MMTPDHPIVLRCLHLLDPSLSSRAQITRLGLSAGMEGQELACLPGLANATRRAAALKELADRGWPDGVGEAKAQKAGPPASSVVRRMLRSKKLRETIRFLGGHAPGLHGRRLSSLAGALSPDEAKGLVNVLKSCDARLTGDAEFRRLRCRPKMDFVMRRIPHERRSLKTVVPVDLVAQTLAKVADEEWDLVDTARHAEHLMSLYRSFAAHGSESIERWWEILTYFSEMGLGGMKLYTEWRLRMESYALRRQIPLPHGVRLATDRSPREIKGRFPVPDCAYGPWIDAEVKLYSEAVYSVSRECGIDIARAAWTRAHELLGDPEDPYGDDVLRDAVGRHARLLEQELKDPHGPWSLLSPIEALEERRAIRRASRWAMDEMSPGRRRAEDLGQSDPTGPQSGRRRLAHALLMAVARRASGANTDSGEIAKLVARILSTPVRAKTPIISQESRIVHRVLAAIAGQSVSSSNPASLTKLLSHLRCSIQEAMRGRLAPAAHCQLETRLVRAFSQLPLIHLVAPGGVRRATLEDVIRACGEELRLTRLLSPLAA